MSISSLLFTSRDPLISNQTAIDVAGGNIANVDTPRQGLQNIDQKIEWMIDDTQGGGIGDLLSKFGSSWGDLSKNPGGIVEQSALFSAEKT